MSGSGNDGLRTVRERRQMKAAANKHESLARAKKVLHHYDGQVHPLNQGAQLMLTDLLIDLMHHAEEHGLDYQLASRTARAAVSADQMLLLEKKTREDVERQIREEGL